MLLALVAYAIIGMIGTVLGVICLGLLGHPIVGGVLGLVVALLYGYYLAICAAR